MKHLIAILEITSISSCVEVHLEYPLKVNTVEINTNSTHKFKYVITIIDACDNTNKALIYTDSLFQVGNLIK